MGKNLVGLLCLLVVISGHFVAGGKATLTQNVFNDVVVAVSSTVAHTNDVIGTLTSSIQNLMQDASQAMFIATGNRLSFGTVSIQFVSTDTTYRMHRNKRDTTIPYDSTTFESADIRVDINNAAYGSLPYTQQSRFCGERGDFIHLTLDFINGEGYDITKYGTADKLLAKEWVKYYFGVFDEQGYDYSNMYPVQYYDPGASAALSICHSQTIQWTDNYCSGQSSLQGLPATCTLKTDKNSGRNQNVNTSMMSSPITPITDHFCSNDSHNAHAPNKHNIMCDGQSIMSVILTNSEVVNSISDTVPTISFPSTSTVISPDNVLALAVLWDNMENKRTTYSAWPSHDKFLMYDFPMNAYYRFVETITPSGNIIPWTQFNSDLVRENFITNISPASLKTTSSVDMTAALNNIVSDTSTPMNTIQVILVIGNSTTSVADWSTMCTTANDKKFQLHLLSYNTASVYNYFNSTCVGRASLIQAPVSPYDSNTWDPSVQDCYQYLMERKLIDSYLRGFPNMLAPNLYGPPQAYYENVHLTSGSNSIKVIADSSWTNRMYFETCENLVGIAATDFLTCYVSYASGACRSSPDGTKAYCSSYVINDTISNVSYNCTVTPEEINGKPNQIPPFVVYSVGQPTNVIDDIVEPPQITLFSWVVTDNSPSVYTRVRIFARLLYGTTPIFNANVTATIVSTTTKPAATVHLRDDGSGNPDISVQDGVYSAYFTQFQSIATYTVTVTADDNNYIALYPQLQYPRFTGSDSMNNLETGKFFRETFAGTFVAKPTTGGIPPGRILNLQVDYSDSSSVTLGWTAPGADLDYGTAKQYYLKCSTNRVDVLNFPTDNNGIGLVPKLAGNREQYIINGNVDSLTHYCTVRTYDGFLYSDSSNVVIYSIVQAGLSSGQIAGISIGVIIVIVIIVIIAVLLFFKVYRKEKRVTSSTSNFNSNANDTKLQPIPVESVPVNAIHQPGYGVENDSAQRHSRPTSGIINSTFSSVDSDNNSKVSKDHMTTFHQNSRTPSPKPVPMPKVPTPPLTAMNVVNLGAPPSHQPLNARPLQSIYEQQPHDNSNLYFVDNPDVARPVRLTQLATIEDTGDYQDHTAYRPDIPVYSHLLNKPLGGPPPAPPKKVYGNESIDSSSSSSSSSSGHTNRTPKQNTQV